MAQWIVVRTSDSRIVGAGTGGTVPADTATQQHVSVTDAERTQIQTLRNELAVEGREEALFWNADTRLAYANADTRPVVNVTLNRAIMAADGVDTVTMTLTVVGSTPTVVRKGWLAGRYWRFSFVAGVATGTWRSFGETGPTSIESTPDLRVANGPVLLEMFAG